MPLGWLPTDCTAECCAYLTSSNPMQDRRHQSFSSSDSDLPVTYNKAYLWSLEHTVQLLQASNSMNINRITNSFIDHPHCIYSSLNKLFPFNVTSMDHQERIISDTSVDYTQQVLDSIISSSNLAPARKLNKLDQAGLSSSLFRHLVWYLYHYDLD